MSKMFYSFDDGNLYYLDVNCDLETLMKEQCTTNGVLIFTEKNIFETITYVNGEPTGFETKLLVKLSDGTVVPKSHRAKPKSVKEAFNRIDKDVEDFFDMIDNMFAGD